MRACEQFKKTLGVVQQLTFWIRFYESISIIQIKPNKCPITHILDKISVIHMEPRKCIVTYSLDGIS